MRIGQRFKTEKIGTISHNAGIISLAASTLNIGGLQVDTDPLSRTISSDVTLIANTLYMVYVVLSSGTPVIRISTNVNSIGPSGFASWKLVGAFISNGVTGSIAFGSFVNIEGSPRSLTSVLYTPIWTGAGSNPSLGNGAIVGRYTLNADAIECTINLDMGSTTTYGTGTWIFSIPANLTGDTTKFTVGTPGTKLGTVWSTNGSAANSIGMVTSSSNSLVIGSIHGNISNINNTQPFAWANGNSLRLKFKMPILGFSNIPLKDL